MTTQSQFIPRRARAKKLHVIEAFAGLSPKRKMALADHLFVQGYESFEKMVKLIWPTAEEKDAKKLEKFLILLKQTAH